MPGGQPARLQREFKVRRRCRRPGRRLAVCGRPTRPAPRLQEEAFRNVIDEVHLQHERLTSVYKCGGGGSGPRCAAWRRLSPAAAAPSWAARLRAAACRRHRPRLSPRRPLTCCVQRVAGAAPAAAAGGGGGGGGGRWRLARHRGRGQRADGLPLGHPAQQAPAVHIRVSGWAAPEGRRKEEPAWRRLGTLRGAGRAAGVCGCPLASLAAVPGPSSLPSPQQPSVVSQHGLLASSSTPPHAGLPCLSLSPPPPLSLPQQGAAGPHPGAALDAPHAARPRQGGAAGGCQATALRSACCTGPGHPWWHAAWCKYRHQGGPLPAWTTTHAPRRPTCRRWSCSTLGSTTSCSAGTCAGGHAGAGRCGVWMGSIQGRWQVAHRHADLWPNIPRRAPTPLPQWPRRRGAGPHSRPVPARGPLCAGAAEGGCRGGCACGMGGSSRGRVKEDERGQRPRAPRPSPLVPSTGWPQPPDPSPPPPPHCHPPCAQVRVLRDFGEIVFTSGKVSLQRGKSHWLPKDEVGPMGGAGGGSG